MSKKKKDNPITPELCKAYRTALDDKIVGLEENIDRVDGRLWKTLAGVILTIILTLIGIVVALLT